MDNNKIHHLKCMLCRRTGRVGKRHLKIEQNQTADLTEELLRQTIWTIIFTKFEVVFLSTDLTGKF